MSKANKANSSRHGAFRSTRPNRLSHSGSRRSLITSPKRKRRICVNRMQLEKSPAAIPAYTPITAATAIVSVCSHGNAAIPRGASGLRGSSCVVSATSTFLPQPGPLASAGARDMQPPMANKTLIDGVAGLRSLVGKELGTGDWRTMTFEAIQKFADATGDHQWIHVDRERARRESPFRAPVAHGYFTLSLIAGLFFELVEVKGFRLVVNYGLNKVRFPAPLKEGARYRLVVRLQDVKSEGNSVEGLLAANIEVEGEKKPACVAEVVFRFYE
jgi:acyl dehydratase